MRIPLIVRCSAVSVALLSFSSAWCQGPSQAHIAEPTNRTAMAVTIAAGTGGPIPTGSVTLTGGGYTSAPAPLSNGSATITVPAGALAGGTDTLTLNYSGDSTYGAATSTTVVTVQGFTINGTAVTVPSGATTGNISTISIKPAGGFTGPVSLSALLSASPTGAVNPPTLSFGATTPAAITGPMGGTSTLTISTVPSSSANCISTGSAPTRAPSVSGGEAVLAGLCLLVFPKRRSWQPRLAMGLLLAVLAGGVLACGVKFTGRETECTSATTSGTTAGVYTITVTGTAADLTQTSTVTLTVQ